MIKSALEWIVNSQRAPAVDIKGRLYQTTANGGLIPLYPGKVPPLVTTTIASLVLYLTDHSADISANKDLVFIVIESDEIRLYGPVKDSCGHPYRELHAIVKAVDIASPLEFGCYYSLEEFNIRAQLMFEPDQPTDFQRMMKITGNLKDSNVTKWNDDGITQKVTIKTGLASVDAVPITNPFHLSRTMPFAELGIYTSTYLLRLRSKGEAPPEAALFELNKRADALTMRRKIAEYIEELTFYPVLI
jgi:hypothetical protein